MQIKTWRHNIVDYVVLGKETGHLLNETSSPAPPPPSSAQRADSYSWPIEVSAFAAELMIARLLASSFTPCSEATQNLLIRQLLTLWWGGSRDGGGGKGMDRRERQRERNPRGKCWHQQPSHSWSSPVARITTEGYNRVWNCFCESLTFTKPL